MTQADIDKLGEDFPAPMDDKPPTTASSGETSAETPKVEVTAQVTASSDEKPTTSVPTEQKPKEPEVLPVMDNMPSFPTGEPLSQPETTESRPTAQGEALLEAVVKENQQSAEGKEDANLNI